MRKSKADLGIQDLFKSLYENGLPETKIVKLIHDITIIHISFYVFCLIKASIYSYISLIKN